MRFQQWHKFLFLIFFGFFLSSCSSNSGNALPGAVEDNIIPSIVTIIPENETTNVEVDSVVRIDFSELMAKKSLSKEEGLKLFSGKADTKGLELSLRDSTVTFSVIPAVGIDVVTGDEIDIEATRAVLVHGDGRFALNTTYTVQVGPPGRDLRFDDKNTSVDERNFLDLTVFVSFTTQDGTWKEAHSVNHDIIESGSIPPQTIKVVSDQFSPVLTSNLKGPVVSAWRQLKGANSEIWVSKFDPKIEGWVSVSSSIATAERVDNIDDSTAFSPNVSTNKFGHIAVIWSQSNPNNSFMSIWVNIFDGEKWLGPQNISDSGFAASGDANSADIKMNDNGLITAIWREWNGTRYRILSRKFEYNISSTNTHLIENLTLTPIVFLDSEIEALGDLAGDALTPKISMSTDGFTMVTWSQDIAGQFKVYSNRSKIGSNSIWHGAERIDISDAGSASFPNIKIEANDDAYAIWLQYDGVVDKVWVRRFVAGSWQVPIPLEEEQRGNAKGADIAVSDNLQTFAFWQQDEGGAQEVFMLRSFSSDTGWSIPIELKRAPKISDANIVFDREGNAMAIWREGIPSGRIKYNRYIKNTDAWQGTNELSNVAGSSSIGIAPILSDGRMLATWADLVDNKSSLSNALFSD